MWSIPGAWTAAKPIALLFPAQALATDLGCHVVLTGRAVLHASGILQCCRVCVSRTGQPRSVRGLHLRPAGAAMHLFACQYDAHDLIVQSRDKQASAMALLWLVQHCVCGMV